MQTILFAFFLLSTSAFAMESKIARFCGDLAIAHQRIDIASANIANAETTRTVAGGPYKKKRLGNCRQRVCEVIEDSAPPRMVYHPDHPDADKNGYLAKPNVNVVEEMADLIKANRAYELVLFSAPSKDFLRTSGFEECVSKYPSLKEHLKR
jgi:flagellar basal-body rod protein FlgC